MFAHSPLSDTFAVRFSRLIRIQTFSNKALLRTDVLCQSYSLAASECLCLWKSLTVVVSPPTPANTAAVDCRQIVLEQETESDRKKQTKAKQQETQQGGGLLSYPPQPQIRRHTVHNACGNELPMLSSAPNICVYFCACRCLPSFDMRRIVPRRRSVRAEFFSVRIHPTDVG